MISYDIGYSGQRLSFDDAVLAHFDRHRQTRFWHREAGGLLFAHLAFPTIKVCAITGPRGTDRRSRYSYWPDERAEQREIDEMFSRGLHLSDAGTPIPRTSHPLRLSIPTISPIACGARGMR